METTIELLVRAKTGDQAALESLVERSMPPLRRWARGHLPQHARSLQETQDLVQNAVRRAIPRLQTFQALQPGALQAFLRQAVANEIAIGREGIERYQEALARLMPRDRQAIIARMELQQSYEEVALALGKPNANAARVAVKRAIERLLREMVALAPCTSKPN